MKELFLISSYTTNITQENQLRNLVFKLKEQNKDVFLITHSHTPDDIVKLCDYYFYDKDNILVPTYKTNGVWFHGNGDFVVESYFNVLNAYNYSVAFSKTLYHGLLISKELGYNNIHFLVYDTDFNSLEEFDNNNKLLEEYDGVFYAIRELHDNSPHEFLPAGYILSFNIDNFSFEELKFKKNQLIEELGSILDGQMAEASIWKNIIKPKNFFKKHVTDVDESKLKLNLSDTTTKSSIRNCMFFIAVEEYTDNALVFALSENKTPLNLSALINNSNYISYNLDPQTWNLTWIGSFNEIHNAKFYKDSELIHEINFDNEDFKKEFKLKSRYWWQPRS